MLEDKEIEIYFTPTSEMHADFLTKNLPRPKFEQDIKAIKLFQNRQGKVLKLSDSYSN